MAEVLDLQSALSNLTISSNDSRNPPASWEEVLDTSDTSVALRDDSVDHDVIRSASASPPRHRSQYDISSNSTPLTPVATSKFGGLPPRYSASQAAESTPSAGKYVPPSLKHAAANTTPTKQFSRQTPPSSPSRTGLIGRSPLPPSGARSGRSTPSKSSLARDSWRSSPQKPPMTPNENCERLDCGWVPSHRTPLKTLCSNEMNTSVAVSAVSSALCSQTSTAPATPSKDSDIVSEVFAVSPGLSKTSIKRVVHDSKATGLTFNQKKHRSPSHMRRSQRRQQERTSLSSPPASSSPVADSLAVSTPPQDIKDPWEDSDEENKAPSSFENAEAASSENKKSNACVHLRFEARQPKTVSAAPR